jgi:hypothetical protein
MLKSLFFSFYLLTFSFLGLTAQSQKPQPKKKVFNSFSENKQWEQRLNEKLRSGQEVRMVTPISGINYDSDKIEFVWQNSPSGKLFLGLLSNENQEVLYKEVTGNKFIIDAKQINLKPGLYYWVFESEQDVLTLGKFFFKKK